MVGVLASGNNAVVAGAAGADDLQVVDGDCRGPLGAFMAICADFGRIDVRRLLAHGHGSVMARAAHTQDLRVVDGVRRRPGHVVMAGLAKVGRFQVSQWVLARRADAVVAADAIAGDVYVVEIGRNPARGRVAVVAVIA